MAYSNRLFGRRIKTARLLAGLTQKDLALRAGGFPYQVICLVERGRQGVSAERVAHLADALDVSADWLLGLSEARARAGTHPWQGRAVGQGGRRRGAEAPPPRAT